MPSLFEEQIVHEDTALSDVQDFGTESFAEALTYFTDLAHIRDETMGYFVAEELKKGGRVLTVAGDWHVQTGLALPDRAVRYAGDSPEAELVTTSPAASLEQVRAKSASGRKLARFVLVYEAP